jgi:hypothetical protein
MQIHRDNGVAESTSLKPRCVCQEPWTALVMWPCRISIGPEPEQLRLNSRLDHMGAR